MSDFFNTVIMVFSEFSSSLFLFYHASFKCIIYVIVYYLLSLHLFFHLNFLIYHYHFISFFSHEIRKQKGSFSLHPPIFLSVLKKLHSLAHLGNTFYLWPLVFLSPWNQDISSPRKPQLCSEPPYPSIRTI